MPDNEITKNGAEMDDSNPENQTQDSIDDGVEKSEDSLNVVEPEMADAKSAAGAVADVADLPDKSPRLDVSAARPPKNPAEEAINKISAIDLEQFSKSGQPSTPHNIDMLLDVAMPISIELGRTAMPIQDILNLGPGSVVELNKLAGEPVDLLVNDKLIAKGEVVVVDENFGIRITSMISQEERIKSLG